MQLNLRLGDERACKGVRKRVKMVKCCGCRFDISRIACLIAATSADVDDILWLSLARCVQRSEEAHSAIDEEITTHDAWLNKCARDDGC